METLRGRWLAPPGWPLSPPRCRDASGCTAYAWVRRTAGLRDAARALESDPSYKLRYQHLVGGKFVAFAHRERARPVIFTRYMGWDSKSLANAGTARGLEHVPVAARQLDKLWHFDPAEADVRHMAGPMDRIKSAKRAFVEPFLPVSRIVVEADTQVRRGGKVHMVRKCKVSEAHRTGAFQKSVEQVT